MGRAKKTVRAAALRVALVSSEVQPFSKTGGLADVSGALPHALAGLGCAVQVFTPLHRSARLKLDALEVEHNRIEMPHLLWVDGAEHQLAFICLELADYEVIFIDCPEYFERSGLYQDEQGRDYQDNVARFSFFCRAVLEYFLFTGEAPDVLHCNDWQTALLPVYLRSQYPQPLLSGIQTLLTIHNLGYQGLFPAEALHQAGLSWDLYHIDGLEFYGQLNLLKGGIVCADAISTVSPTYAKEIQTEEYGAGLAGLLQAQKGKLSGILNGIDTELWDPLTDSRLPAQYCGRKAAGKAVCKRALQQAVGLPVRRYSMLLGLVTRLDAQKGVELLLAAWPTLRKLDLQLVVLGSGSPQLEAALLELAASEPLRVAVQLSFNDELAHQIYAGADSLLMPSLYEPCGLNQMYAQRYGSVPIVRQTGGLRDTVRNATSKRLARGSASGFSFKAAAPKPLALAIRAAARLFSRHPRQWQKLWRSIMAIDNSWDSSARDYLKLYRRLLKAAAKGRAEDSPNSEGKKAAASLAAEGRDG